MTTVRYSIRFNGALSAPFAPSRGLRHGDPLSPYLFLFVADGLSQLINRKIRDNSLKELKICRGAPGFPAYSLLMTPYYSSKHRWSKRRM
jgi:hypothetical protein